MASDIDWCDHTITAGVYGCDPISEGCRLCWSARLASTRFRHLPKYAGLTTGRAFNGTVRIVPEEADEPLHLRKPRGRIFVASKADLFHHLVPAEHVARLFAAMIAAPQHTYQLLTKRGPRMEKMLRSAEFWQLVSDRLGELWHCPPPAPLTMVPEWIWIGVSVEDQKAVRRRVPPLLRTPALTRWLSVEPLLGPVDLSPYLTGPAIHWVVVGGESGTDAYAMHPAWVRTVRDQTVAAGVAFFFKQWGQWGPAPWMVGREDGEPAEAYKARAEAVGATHALPIWSDQYDNMITEVSHKPWSCERVPLAPGDPHAPMRRWGHKAAGHVLDGREWREFPQLVWR